MLIGGLPVRVDVQKQLWCVQGIGLEIDILPINEIFTAIDNNDDNDSVADLLRWLVSGPF